LWDIDQENDCIGLIIEIKELDMSISTGIMGIKEMADYLNMKEQTVYRLVQQKKIPAIKIGGQWKAKKNHIDRLFDDMLQEKLKEIQI
jgi:excisionase family DNA binding protein